MTTTTEQGSPALVLPGEPLRLDAFHNTNWNVYAAPVAILNESSTTHERIAYCWGLANSLHDLSMFLNESSNLDMARISGLFFNQLSPLVDMLERLGSDTCNNNGGRV